MSDGAKRERWGFVFEALASEVPAANRVRSLLKTALRVYGLRNVRMLTSDECNGQPIPPVDGADASRTEPPF